MGRAAGSAAPLAAGLGPPSLDQQRFPADAQGISQEVRGGAGEAGSSEESRAIEAEGRLVPPRAAKLASGGEAGAAAAACLCASPAPSPSPPGTRRGAWV